MAPPPASDTAEGNEKISAQTDEERKYVLQVGWKALFGFTTKKHLPLFSGAIFSASIAAATLPVFAIVYGLIFRDYTDYGIGKISSSALRDSVTRYCLILSGIALLNWMANSLYFFFFLTFGELQARSARNRIFDALIRKDMAWFDTRETGIAAFLPAIQMHIRDLQLAVSAPFGEGTQCIIQGLGALGVAFFYSWNLTLVILCTVPLIYLVQSFIAHRLSIRANEQAVKLQSALKYIANAIQSIETVKCFNGEQYELHMFTKITGMAASIYMRVANLRSLQIGVMQFFTLSVFVQGFWYGTHLVKSGDRNVGQVITTFWAALMAIQGITGFLPQFIVLQKGKMAGAHLRLLMDQISSNDQRHEMDGDWKPKRCSGDIEFRQVTFSYPTRSEEIAIRNISLFFPAGETTFVLGKSGSGKSTLGQLLARFYQPISGQILLDNVVLEKINVQWLRQNVTLVEQHSVLFNDNIRENIALGRPGGAVSLEDIESAIKFALLDPIIESLPDGIHTELGIKGSSLSGGQKQRMALARAKIRDTPVLILDESTSALDYITRGAILHAIRRWRKGKTTIVITHDISQIQSDDFLYLMEDAQVVQEGYRKELEAQPGAFRALLADREEDKEAASDNEDSDNGDEMDEIISLYDEGSWNLHSPMHRPISAVLFAENVLSPFLSKGRESFAGGLLAGFEKRLTKHEEERTSNSESPHSSIDFSSDLDSVKLPPCMPSGAFQLRDLPSRPSSQHKRLSGVISYNRPMIMSKDYGSRPVSMASSRPVMRASTYPRRLSISAGTNAPLVQEQKASTGQKLRTKLRLGGSQSDPTKSVSTDSLPILEIFKSVWPMLQWRPRMLLMAAIFCACIHSACTPLFAWIFAKLLTTFYDTGNQSKRSLQYAMAILGIAVGDGLATYQLFFLADSVAQSWAHALKVEAMRRILLQPQEFFDREENSMSRLAETLDHFAEEARNLPGRFAGIFITILFMICISITWSLITSWKLALVALACAPAIFIITKVYNMISSHWERLANEADDEVGQLLHETFVNIRTVRCLNLEDHFRRKYKAATTAAVNVGIKRALYSGSIFGLNFAGVLFVAILLFWYGAVLVSKNEYTVSQITETFLILMLSVNHVHYMSNYITQINISREAGSRLLRLARMPTTSHELTGTIEIHEASDIVFNNVNFTYPTRKDVQVLHDVSFTIPRGSCTAIVGSSGSGKSTIAALLLKLYETDANTLHAPDLTVSGSSIKSLNTTSLRARMAIVSQTPTIFPGTIAQNIAYGLSPSSHMSSMTNIRAAAHAAGVAAFIDSLPNGYATLVGEGGTGLSGGQAQRLALARALVREPDILVLDEATSALDILSAGVVRDTIKNLLRDKSLAQTYTPSVSSHSRTAGFCAHDEERQRSCSPMSPGSRTGGFWDDKVLESGCAGRKGKEPRKRMTVIIITHAREMMAIAEHVVMLDKGRVVEQGSFGELKRKKGGAFGRLLRGEREDS
ncbi:P-loop containing nucleoside triphosphate hydrolase protein [Ampelomyces quisqualis]|uniref:P-loop containing nucleoside triphosphate hydrolase protein n=1 Tax=Ampelomyces quisqualis TaxID=50730 RepID=A0A6A5QGH5_AMPQU|nr:P-loop containing nucleoside triphosphate hydrolase protein [Ampelomyces quisqualis]